MVIGIRTNDPHELTKERGSMFCVGSRVRQTPEEGRWTYQPKRCGNNNEDEENSPKILNDENKNEFSRNISFFIQGRTSSDSEEVLP